MPNPTRQVLSHYNCCNGRCIGLRKSNRQRRQEGQKQVFLSWITSMMYLRFRGILTIIDLIGEYSHDPLLVNRMMIVSHPYRLDKQFGFFDTADAKELHRDAIVECQMCAHVVSFQQSHPNVDFLVSETADQKSIYKRDASPENSPTSLSFGYSAFSPNEHWGLKKLSPNQLMFHSLLPDAPKQQQILSAAIDRFVWDCVDGFFYSLKGENSHNINFVDLKTKEYMIVPLFPRKEFCVVQMELHPTQPRTAAVLFSFDDVPKGLYVMVFQIVNEPKTKQPHRQTLWMQKIENGLEMAASCREIRMTWSKTNDWVCLQFTGKRMVFCNQNVGQLFFENNELNSVPFSRIPTILSSPTQEIVTFARYIICQKTHGNPYELQLDTNGPFFVQLAPSTKCGGDALVILIDRENGTIVQVIDIPAKNPMQRIFPLEAVWNSVSDDLYVYARLEHSTDKTTTTVISRISSSFLQSSTQ